MWLLCIDNECFFRLYSNFPFCHWMLFCFRCVNWRKKRMKLVSLKCSALTLLGFWQLFSLEQRTSTLFLAVVIVDLNFRVNKLFLTRFHLWIQCGKHWSNCIGHRGSNSNIWWGWCQCSNWSNDCMYKSPFSLFLSRINTHVLYEHIFKCPIDETYADMNICLLFLCKFC